MEALSNMDWDLLKSYVDEAGGMMGGVDAASNKGNPNDAQYKRMSLAQKVESRLEFGALGYKLQAITGSPFSEKGPAPKKNPPVNGGMRYCVDKVVQAIITDYKPGGRNPGLAEIPRLIRRIRELFRVYYDFRVNQSLPPEGLLILANFCDFTSVYDVSSTLHKVALYLQLDPPRMEALMTAGQDDIVKVLLEEELDYGPYRKELTRLNKKLEKDQETDDDDREYRQLFEDTATKDLAAYAMTWFFGTSNVAFVINVDAYKNSSLPWTKWKEMAVKRLVKWTTHALWRDVLGDPMTDAMRPIYWDTNGLVQFAHAGGLAALFGDWVNSTCVKLVGEVLSKLPERVWENQTKQSLANVLREIQTKEGHETKKDTAGPVIVSAFFNIYKRYDVAPFTAASKHETWETSVLYYYLSHRIRNEQPLAESLTKKANWQKLMNDYVSLPYSIERRYKWSNLKISDRWDCLTYYGCDNDACQEKKALLEARTKRKRGVRDSEWEERLERWGKQSKPCSACQSTSYCSRECQREHWKAHKPKCLTKRK